MTVPQKIKGRSFSAPAFAAPGMECRLFFTNVILILPAVGAEKLPTGVYLNCELYICA